jgi:hypothetical protein
MAEYRKIDVLKEDMYPVDPNDPIHVWFARVADESTGLATDPRAAGFVSFNMLALAVTMCRAVEIDMFRWLVNLRATHIKPPPIPQLSGGSGGQPPPSHPAHAWLSRLATGVTDLIQSYPERCQDIASGMLGIAVAACDACDVDVVATIHRVGDSLDDAAEHAGRLTVTTADDEGNDG